MYCFHLQGRRVSKLSKRWAKRMQRGSSACCLLLDGCFDSVKMETVRSSETSTGLHGVTSQKVSTIHGHRCENLKPHILTVVSLGHCTQFQETIWAYHTALCSPATDRYWQRALADQCNVQLPCCPLGGLRLKYGPWGPAKTGVPKHGTFCSARLPWMWWILAFAHLLEFIHLSAGRPGAFHRYQSVITPFIEKLYARRGEY
jgi:hypothetical protein